MVVVAAAAAAAVVVMVVVMVVMVVVMLVVVLGAAAAAAAVAVVTVVMVEGGFIGSSRGSSTSELPYVDDTQNPETLDRVAKGSPSEVSAHLFFWVAVKEIKLHYLNGYIYIVINMVAL